MATKDFEIQQLLKAYRKGLISDELFEAQMQELGAATGGLEVANVLALRGDASKASAQMLQKTPQSQTMAFTRSAFGPLGSSGRGARRVVKHSFAAPDANLIVMICACAYVFRT